MENETSPELEDIEGPETVLFEIGVSGKMFMVFKYAQPIQQLREANTPEMIAELVLYAEKAFSRFIADLCGGVH